MKAAILKVFLILIISNSFGQTFEIAGGINKNKYTDLGKPQDNPFYSTKFSPGYGYSFAISIVDLGLDTSLQLRMTLRIDNYQGKFYCKNGGLPGSSETEAEVKKTTIGIGLYPININIKKRFHIFIGPELSVKLHDRTSGYKSSWFMGSHTSMTIENDSVKINRPVCLGVSLTMSYDIRIKENWFISPQYRFYIGWAEEFENTQASIHSIRNNFAIGVVRKLK